VRLEGDSSRRVLQRTATPGQKLMLDPAGTADPDGDTLTYRWWHYREPGTYAGQLDLQKSDTPAVSLIAPMVNAPSTAHLVLEVTDSGNPRLTSYRRVVVTFNPR
jgi:hypothetical protein